MYIFNKYHILCFLGIQTPVCAVSGAKFLTEDGWTDLRNPTDTDVPFRLFRDEGRTFLQVNIVDFQTLYFILQST